MNQRRYHYVREQKKMRHKNGKDNVAQYINQIHFWDNNKTIERCPNYWQTNILNIINAF